jgi:hypothetical protein
MIGPPPPRIQVGNVIVGENYGARFETDYSRQIAHLSDQVSKLASQVESGSKIDSATIEELKDRIDQVASAGEKLMAPIRLPAPEDMEVRLVSAGALDRLDEYHNDDTFYLTLFGLFAGGAIGIVVNTVTQPSTGSPIPQSLLYWITLALLILVSGIFFAQSRKTRQRAQRIKNATLDTEALSTDAKTADGQQDSRLDKRRRGPDLIIQDRGTGNQERSRDTEQEIGARTENVRNKERRSELAKINQNSPGNDTGKARKRRGNGASSRVRSYPTPNNGIEPTA